KGRGGAAAFFRRPLVAAAARVRFLLVRRTICNIDAPAVCLPSRNARGEIFVGVRDAPVVLFLEFVFDRVRGRVAAKPEVLDELLPLFVGLKALERGALFIGDDVRDVFVEPLAIGGLQLLAELLLLAPALSFRHRLGDGFALGAGSLFLVVFLGSGKDTDTQQD